MDSRVEEQADEKRAREEDANVLVTPIGLLIVDAETALFMNSAI